MSEKRKGVALQVPEGSKMATCPNCGELVFAVMVPDLGEVLVQPVVIRGLIADQELIQGANPLPHDELIKKVIARSATAKFSPSVLVPHDMVCIDAVLIRTLPAPTKLVAQGPDPTKPPPGHKPVTHDLEIQSGKLGTSSRFKKEGDNGAN